MGLIVRRQAIAEQLSEHCAAVGAILVEGEHFLSRVISISTNGEENKLEHLI